MPTMACIMAKHTHISTNIPPTCVANEMYLSGLYAATKNGMSVQCVPIVLAYVLDVFSVGVGRCFRAWHCVAA